jgi:hypothetical protein
LTDYIIFRTCIADIVFEVSCQYHTTRNLCRDYPAQPDDPVCETVCITPEDLEGERQRLLRKKNPGELLEASTPEALERLHLCRRISELLTKYNRVLFHGSSLAIDGRGVLFTAKSGTGKSTHTRLWRQEFGDRVRMINDDKPFLHIAEDGITVYGTPWRGKHALGDNVSAPLKAIVKLTRGETNSIAGMNKADAFQLLLRQVYMPEYKDLVKSVLKTENEILNSIPFFLLKCNMEKEAAEISYQGIFEERRR